MNRSFLSAAFGAVLANAPAFANEVLFDCADATGHLYILDEGAGAAGPGWQPGTFTSGQVLLVQNDDGLDVLLNDVQGPRSVKETGGVVVSMDSGPDRLVVDVVYDVSVTRYLFVRYADRAEVIFSHFAHGAPVNYGGLYQAECN